MYTRTIITLLDTAPWGKSHTLELELLIDGDTVTDIAASKGDGWLSAVSESLSVLMRMMDRSQSLTQMPIVYCL